MYERHADALFWLALSLCRDPERAVDAVAAALSYRGADAVAAAVALSYRGGPTRRRTRSGAGSRPTCGAGT
ncbi:hypothetical protein [Streptomyces sp. NPDC008139]|uniref:hypothetical protein n=1 Tax=Streptomyces sp. NPDC008139 TaxID=3364814 RepID=UPI0036ED733C